MLKLKHSVIILMCAIFFLVCGCTQTIESDADELRSSVWSAETENGTRLILHFDINHAELEIIGTDDESSAKINGACVMNDSGFIITDDSMGEIFYFTYSLSGDTAIISYDDEEIEFSRVIEETDNIS